MQLCRGLLYKEKTLKTQQAIHVQKDFTLQLATAEDKESKIQHLWPLKKNTENGEYEFLNLRNYADGK